MMRFFSCIGPTVLNSAAPPAPDDQADDDDPPERDCTDTRVGERHTEPLVTLVYATLRLMIVPVPDPSLIVAPVGLDSRIVNVSLGSTRESLFTGTVMIFWVSPGANVTVPATEM